MKAVFLVPMENGAPVLPPMEADGGTQLVYEKNGERRGGYWIGSKTPSPIVAVMAEMSEAAFSAMCDDDTYLFLTETEEEDEI